jgi:hypothetical protein
VGNEIFTGFGWSEITREKHFWWKDNHTGGQAMFPVSFGFLSACGILVSRTHNSLMAGRQMLGSSANMSRSPPKRWQFEHFWSQLHLLHLPLVFPVVWAHSCSFFG